MKMLCTFITLYIIRAVFAKLVGYNYCEMNRKTKKGKAMQALVYTMPHRVEIRDWPEPQLPADHVLVRVKAAAICGSDLHGFLGHSKIRIPPMVMGHEFAGEVMALGSAVTDIALGTRVTVQPLIGCGACRSCRQGQGNRCTRRQLMGAHLQGGFAERIAVPRQALYVLPNSVSYAEAALTEPLANGVHMARLAPINYEDVVVIGAGTLGLMALQAYRLNGARRVVALDTAPNRLEVAKRLGAHATINPATDDVSAAVLGAFDNELAAVVVEAVGRAGTRRQATELVRPGGTVVMLGLAEVESTFDMLSAINREIRIQCSYGSNDADMRDALSMIADGRVDVTSWVEQVPLERGQEIFTRLVKSPQELVKAVFVF
jgi:threonine dehydrogenase-like Zn-dependent dehydrogenase